MHAAHAWTFYEKSQKSDTTGPYKDVPYDGNIKKTDGANQWWNGLDPQELYAQNHKPSLNGDNQEVFFTQWDWSHGASIPDKNTVISFLTALLI